MTGKMPSSADGYLRSTTDHHGYILGEEADEYKVVATQCEVVGNQTSTTKMRWHANHGI